VAEALLRLPPKPPLDEAPVACVAPPPVAISVREAALAPGEWVPLAQAEGRVAASCAGAYPPGVPLIVPGEAVTAEAAQALAAPGQRFGIASESLFCVKGEPNCCTT